MPIDKGQWDKWFSTFPSWTCPQCHKGHLKLVKKSMFDQIEGKAKREYNQDYHNPMEDYGRFAAILCCDKATCAAVSTISGKYGFDPCVDEENQSDYQQIFEVESIIPAPLPFRYPDGTPKAVLSHLVKAAELIWRYPEAAVSHIRHSVEAFLTSEKIPAFKRDPAKGKLNRHSLDNRIILYGKLRRGKEIANTLRAAKWIGNIGSHSPSTASVSREDVLLAFEIMEHVLEERFGTSRTILARKVSVINKKRGLPKPRPTSSQRGSVRKSS
jgi:hypothetical protein